MVTFFYFVCAWDFLWSLRPQSAAANGPVAGAEG